MLYSLMHKFSNKQICWSHSHNFCNITVHINIEIITYLILIISVAIIHQLLSSTDLDNIHLLLVKKYSSSLSYSFYLIFNMSLNKGTVPDTWKYTSITSILKKKGSFSEPLNDRLISLTSIPWKIMEIIIFITLYTFFKECIIFKENRNGFCTQ